MNKNKNDGGENIFLFQIYDPFYKDLKTTFKNFRDGTKVEQEPYALKRRNEYFELFDFLSGELYYDWNTHMSYPQQAHACDCIPIACFYAETIMNDGFINEFKQDIDGKKYRSLMIKRMTEMFDSFNK